MEDLNNLSLGLKYLGIGIAMIPIGIVGLGVARVFSSLIETYGRNPEAKNTFTYALIGFALTEAAALYVLVVVFIMLF